MCSRPMRMPPGIEEATRDPVSRVPLDRRTEECLLDEINVDIAAVLLGSGVRLFDHLAGTPAVLGNPTVIPGVGVTHLRYPVRKA